jgi:hypothetical protein
MDFKLFEQAHFHNLFFDVSNDAKTDYLYKCFPSKSIKSTFKFQIFKTNI